MAATESLMPNSEDRKTPQTYNIETGQVKFSKDADNVDVNASSKLIGLTKEQLEQYRNDPFWKPIRYALFILFWLVWLLMFVGAILIVVLSPKCAAKEVTKWSKVAVAYQIFTPTFYDSDNDGVGDFEGIRQKLNYLRKIGATTVWARHVIQANKDDYDPSQVTDHANIDNRLIVGKKDEDKEQELRNLIEAIHDKDLFFVMDLPLTVYKSHSWVIENKTKIAKKFDDATNENIRVINLDDSSVEDVILSTAKKYLNLGVDGFYFSEYGGTKTGFNKKWLDGLGQKIKRQIENDENLKEKDILLFADSRLVSDKTNSSIEFYVKPLMDCDKPKVHECITDVIDLEKEIANENPNGKAQPLWELTDLYGNRTDLKFVDYTEQEKAKLGSLASLLQLFLKGPSSILYGEELALPSFNNSQRGYMRWTADKETNHGFSNIGKDEKLFFKTFESVNADVDTQSSDIKSPFGTFKGIAKLRQRDEVLQVGKLNIISAGESSWLLSRFIDNNALEKVYILAVNFDKKESKSISKDVLNNNYLTQGRSLSKAEILVISAYNDKYYVRQVLNLNDQELELDPLHGIVFSLSPGA